MHVQHQAVRKHGARALEKVLRGGERLGVEAGKADHRFQRLTYRDIVIDDKDDRPVVQVAGLGQPGKAGVRITMAWRVLAGDSGAANGLQSGSVERSDLSPARPR